MTARMLIVATVALAPMGLLPLVGAEGPPTASTDPEAPKNAKAKANPKGSKSTQSDFPPLVGGIGGLIGASDGRPVDLTPRDSLPAEVQTVLRRHEREVRNRARAVASACATGEEINLTMGVAGQLECRAIHDERWTGTHIATAWGEPALLQPERFETLEHDDQGPHCCRVELVTPSTFAPGAVDLSVEVPYEGGVARLFVALPL